MIVRLNRASQLLITQPDHAALAARIMGAWRADGFIHRPAHALILHAIHEHDNGWREVDAAPIVDDGGRVLDFVNAPADVRRAIWPRGVSRLAATPYAAALVAQHALHVYRRNRSDPEWAPFFTEMEGCRDRHLHAAASLTLDDLLRDYLFVRVGDLASLTFCNAWAETQTDDAGSGYRISLEDARLTIEPDPFGGREVPFQIAARELPNRPFGSAAEARRAFAGARVLVVEGVAAG